MAHSIITGGRLAGLMLVLSLLIVSPASATGAPPARITIHKVVCSTEARNLYAECHGNRLAGADFTVSRADDGATVTTDENGIVAFLVGPGRWTIADTPGEITNGGAFVFCSTEARPGSGNVLGGVRTAHGAVTIGVASAEHVFCDWYDLVTPGTLLVTIHIMDCPKNTLNPLATCHGLVPVRLPGENRTLALNADAGLTVTTTNAHGVATAQVATPRTDRAHVTLAAEAAAVPAAGAFVFCSIDGHAASGDVLRGVVTRSGSVQFDVVDVTDNPAITCDWYNRI